MQLTVRPVTPLAIMVETMVRPPVAQGLEKWVALETARAAPVRPAAENNVERLDATESRCFATRRRKPVIIDC